MRQNPYQKAAIDYFVTNVGFHDEDGYPIEDECELREIWTGYFDGIPSAEPHWIPCSERLPELRHDVLLTVFFHEKWNVTEGYRQDGEFMFWNHGRLDSVLDEENRVIAWMPKPEPYKEVTE